MGRRKISAEKLLNQERCIATLPTARVQYRTTLSTLLITEYALPQLQSLLTETHTTLLFTTIYTNTEKHRHHLLPPLLNTYTKEQYTLLFVFIHTDTCTNRHYLFQTNI